MGFLFATGDGAFEVEGEGVGFPGMMLGRVDGITVGDMDGAADKEGEGVGFPGYMLG